MLRVGHVTLENQGSNPTRLDLSRGLLGPGPVAQIVDRDVDLEFSQREGSRATDPARRSGYKGALATEFEIHLHLQRHKLTRVCRENKRGTCVFW